MWYPDIDRSADYYQRVPGLSGVHQDAWGEYSAVLVKAGSWVTLFPASGTLTPSSASGSPVHERSRRVVSARLPSATWIVDFTVMPMSGCYRNLGQYPTFTSSEADIPPIKTSLGISEKQTCGCAVM